MSALSSEGGWGRRPYAQPASDLPTPAEAHLGDRLAALVDGELGHDSRERVLAHLATCRNCKVEADAQRRLKNVFADAAPPPPSEGLMARLQGLPAAGPDGFDGSGPGGGDPSASALRDLRGPRGGTHRRREKPDGNAGPAAPFGVLPEPGRVFDQLPGGSGGRSSLTPARGFRIHESERPSSWRSRRFAFAAAGAVSAAALAFGGALGSGANGSTPVAAPEGKGSSVGQPRSASNGAGTDRDGRRRGGGGEAGGALVSNGSPGAPAETVRTTAAVSPFRVNHAYPLLRDAVFAPPLIRSAMAPSSSPRVSEMSPAMSDGAGQRRSSVTKALPSTPMAPGIPARR